MPSAAAAREAFSTLDSDTQRLADRVVTPWWYHLALGAVAAVFVVSQLLPEPASSGVLVLGIAAIPLLTAAYSRRYGVSLNQPAGPRSRRLLMTTVGVLLAAMAFNVFIKLAGSSPLWSLLAALVAFVATVALGRRYDEAFRDELGAGELGGGGARN